MINDPGKHSVKGGDWAVSLRARECVRQAVNAPVVIAATK
jgi:hypothetical protein